MTCTSCGENNRDGAKFCAECGSALARVCRNCSAELSPAARFCDECGTPTSEASDDGEPTPDDRAVRKTVTILFADLVGSTAFGEAVDPESARREMATYHQLSRTVIEHHGGTLVKFIGDGVMAIFGVPDVAEDDADRAVRAGLDLQREFDDIASGISTRYDLTVGLRVGINSGEIVIAEDDADMVGDAINTAARIEAQCTPGKVLVGEQTWRMTRSAVDYEVLGEVRVKGKDEPVATFQVIATVQDEEVATPFVGRADELATLTAALDDTMTDGSPQLVTVIGSPGVGKTRLAAELAARATRVSTFDLRVDRAGAATLEPIADLLRGVVDLPDGLDPDDVAQRLSLFVGETDDRGRLVPLLASFVGAAPLRSTEESLWAARRLVEVITAERPAVIVIDDIQWAEPLFLDLLEHLVEWVDGPAFLVALARPEIREIRPAFAETGRRISEVVSLEGLDAATTEALAAGILGTDRLPPGLAARLPESTQGNPLFVRELVRMLVDDGTITETADGWTLSIDVDAVEVPPTITSLLASRVERMDDDERRVIEMAGIVGSEFARGAVAALMPDMGGAQLDRILERLRRQEVLDATGSYWGDEPLWRFHHVLIRDAAYRRLLKERRADLHRRVAEWTTATAARIGGEHEISIAFHYERAHEYLGELGPLDAEAVELGVRAAELLTIAARRALDQDDLSAAGTLSQRALDRLSADEPRRPELLLIGCEAFFSAARVHDGEPMLDELRTYGENDSRLAAWAEAFAGQHVVLTEPGRLGEAEPKVAAAAEALADLDDNAGVAKARLVRALVLARQGRVGDAEEELDLALFAAREADDRRRITAVLGAAPLAAVWGPSPVARAGGRCLDIIRLLRITAASPMVEATSIRCQAVLEAMRGRFDESRQLIARSAATVEELGLRHGVLETAMYAGYIELLAGDPVAAEPHLRTAYAGLGSLGVGADAGQAAAHLARAIFAQGRVDEAAEIADDSDALAGQGLQALIASRSVRAEIAAARGENDEALQLATEAVDIAGLTDFTMDHADATRSLAAVLDRAGRSPEAAAASGAATALYEAKGATPTSTPSGPPDMTESEEPENETAATSRTFWHDMGENIVVGTDQLPPLRNRASDVFRTVRLAIHEGRDLDAATQPATEDFEVVAIRGDHLALNRVIVTREDSTFGGQSLEVVEIDDDGIVTASVHFEIDDLADAIAELNRRYREELQPDQRAMLDFVAERGAAHQDPVLVRSSVTDDFEWVDHRLVGFPTAAAEAWVEMVEAAADQLGNRQMLMRRLLSISENALLIDGEIQGGDNVWTGLMLMVRHGDRFCRTEIFPTTDVDRALARYAELAESNAPGTRPPPRNRASAVIHAFWSALFDDHDLDAALSLLSNDFAATDRRSLIGVAIGRSDLAATFEDVLDRDSEQAWTLEDLCVRGDRLALYRLTNTDPGSGFERSMLTLAEIDNDGMVTTSTSFDPDDIDAGLDEMTERFLVGEGAEFRDIVELTTSVRTAANAADARALLTDDFTFVDHRPLSFADTDAAGYVQILAGTDNVVGPSRILTRRLVAITDSALLSDLSIFSAGGDWDLLMLHVRRGDRLSRTEAFEADDVDHARARFHELTEPPPETAASRFAAEMFAVILRGDRDAFETRVLDQVQVSGHPPLRAALPNPRGTQSVVDRVFARLEQFPASTMHVVATRGELLTISAVNFQSASGFEMLRYMLMDFAPDGTLLRLANFGDERLDEATEMLDAWWAESDRREMARAGLRNPASDAATRSSPARHSGGSAEFEVIAIRGERNALVRWTFSAEGSDPGGETLELVTLDAGGRVAQRASFETVEFRLAQDELNRLYLADEGAPFRDVVEVAWATGKASEGTDAEWADGAHALFATDFTIVDHRPISMPMMDKGTAIASGHGLETDRQVVVSQYHRIAATALLIHRVDNAKNDSGGDVTWESLTLMVVRDRQATLVEYFAVDQLEAANARFDELTAAEATPEYLTLAERAGRRLDAAQASEDWATFADLIHEDLVGETRRTGLRETLGREQIVAFAQAGPELGMTISPESTTIVVTRGQHLVLAERTIGGDESWVSSFTFVAEIDDDSRLLRFVQFDPDRREEADTLLDEWWRDSLAPGALATLAVISGWSDAARAHDRERLENFLHEDLVVNDHRSARFEGGDRESFMDATEALRESPDIDIQVPHIPVLNESGGVVSVVMRTPDGTEAWAGIVVHLVTDGHITRLEMYPTDEMSAAVDRFYELTEPTPEPAPAQGNLATRARIAWHEAMEAGDREAAARLVAADFAVVDSILAFTERGMDRAHEIVAWRGERLALETVTRTNEAGDRVEIHTVTQVDAAGLIVCLEPYGEDDFAAADRRLNELWLDEQGIEFKETGELTIAFGERVTARDSEGIRRLLHPEFRNHMHKKLSHDVLDSEGFLENMAVWSEMAGSVRIVTREVLHASRLGMVATMDLFAVDPSGMETEWSAVNVLVVKDGKLINFEEFEPEDVDAALARFAELTGN